MKNFSLFNTSDPADSAAPLARGVAVSSTNTYYSKKASGSMELSLQMEWTGTPTGAITIQGSNRAEPDETTDDDWFTITPTTAPASPAGSASATFGEVNDVNCKWKRVKYVNASGSGTLSGDAAVGEQM
jgi:hypothetical protein